MYSDLPEKTPSMLYGEGDRLTILRDILQSLGHPDKQFKIIHVAGTNGKGSTSQMIASLLQVHGEKVGLFTSPHLFTERESLQVNQNLISISDFKQYLKKVKDVLRNDNLPSEITLSQFEWVFLAAMAYFSDQQCTYVVLECGVGGALDATNAISHSEYAIFTKIGIDHIRILGGTIEEIVKTKAGIIKPQQTVIIAPNQKSETVPLIKSVAKKAGALACIHETRPIISGDDNSGFTLIPTNMANTGTIDLGLKGVFQKENLTTTLLWYKHWLANRNEHLTISKVNQALSLLSLPGRFEKVSEEPLVILDAAHNMDAMDTLIKSIQQTFPGQHLTLVCGFLKDKDVEHMVAKLAALPAQFIVTTPDFPERALAAKSLQAIFERYTLQAISCFQSPDKAVDYAIAHSDTPIIILGSFHLIKTVRRRFVD